MKRKQTIHKILLIAIGIVGILLAAALLHKGYGVYQERVRQKQLQARRREVLTQVEELERQIREMAEQTETEQLQAFLNDKMNTAEHAHGSGYSEAEDAGMSERGLYGEAVTGGALPGEGVTSNELPAGSVTSDELPPARITGNELPPESVTGNDASGNQVTGNGLPPDTEESVTGNSVTGNSVTGNELTPESENVSGNALTGPALLERRALKASYQETMEVNRRDRERIAANTLDFSEITIACLGDSITAGENPEGDPEKESYSYPQYLKQILKAKEVYNLGIGGSSYGRYWDQPFVERYARIPEDADIILVFGGTNDAFSADRKDYGSLDERKNGTFCGDVDELMRGLLNDYPDAQVIFVTQLPNILQDVLMGERDYLLPSSLYADTVRILAAQYNIPVIDLYNSNILDTHDPAVIKAYMPDGVHGNAAGYQVLAQHLAGEIIAMFQQVLGEGQ